MAIEKSLDQLEDETNIEVDEATPVIEIEIEGNEDGEIEIEIKEPTFEENLADELDAKELLSIADEVLENIRIDMGLPQGLGENLRRWHPAAGLKDGRAHRTLGRSLWCLPSDPLRGGCEVPVRNVACHLPALWTR
jgi:hypothetical protein